MWPVITGKAYYEYKQQLNEGTVGKITSSEAKHEIAAEDFSFVQCETVGLSSNTGRLKYLNNADRYLANLAASISKEDRNEEKLGKKAFQPW